MHNCVHEENIDHVREIGIDVRRSASSATLDLLRAVDMVVEHLSKLQVAYGEQINDVRDITARVKRCKPVHVIDEKDVVCDLLSAAEEALQVHVAVLRKQLASAQADGNLRGHKKDAVVSEYRNAIAVTADLHNSILDLRWTIMEHDADLEKPIGKVYTDVDEMFKDMGL